MPIKVYHPSLEEFRLLDKLNIKTSDDLVRCYEKTHDERVSHIYRFIMTGSIEPTFKYMMMMSYT